MYYFTLLCIFSFCMVIGILPLYGDNPCLRDVEELQPYSALPNPLVFCDGTPVKTKEDWEKRREEIKDMLAFYEYGHAPTAPPIVSVEKKEERELEGENMLYREYRVVYGPPEFELAIGLYMPRAKEGRLPVVLFIPKFWKENDTNVEVARKCANRGYALCVFDKGALDDDSGNRDQHIYRIYPDYDWRSLAVWGWGALRVLDFLETLPEIDTKRLVLTGHSRRGKASLWASAHDPRVPLVVAHCSGTGGNGSYRVVGKGAETLKAIIEGAGHWFVSRLGTFIGREDRLPFDQHFLKALIAPRGQLAREALGDLWANPMGTQVMHQCTLPVYKLLGAESRIGIHYREGGHDLIPEDWDVLLDYADYYFHHRPAPRGLNELPFKEVTLPAWAIE